MLNITLKNAREKRMDQIQFLKTVIKAFAIMAINVLNQRQKAWQAEIFYKARLFIRYIGLICRVIL